MGFEVSLFLFRDEVDVHVNKLMRLPSYPRFESPVPA
jgi:hypothetical protein